MGCILPLRLIIGCTRYSIDYYHAIVRGNFWCDCLEFCYLQSIRLFWGYFVDYYIGVSGVVVKLLANGAVRFSHSSHLIPITEVRPTAIPSYDIW